METTRDAIRQTLDEVKAFLAQESPPNLSEADTKAYFVEPVIRALGWEGLGVVTREYYVRNSQEFIDYVLRGPTGLLMAIETKKLGVDLAEKHAAQLVQYCAVDGIEWAALTNGRELQFFNAFLKGDLAAKRILRLDLLAFNTEEEFAAIFAQLWQLSRQQLTAPAGIRTWMHQRRMDALLRRVVANPASPAIGLLQTLMGEHDIPATAQDLVQWFRANLAGGATVVPFAPRQEPAAAARPTVTVPLPDPVSAERPLAAAPDRGRLWPLIEAGLLASGMRLVLIRGKTTVAEATVGDDGTIAFDGKSYRSPSDKVFARLMGRQSLNGWREWWVEIDVRRVRLDDLRQRVAATDVGKDRLATG